MKAVLFPGKKTSTHRIGDGVGSRIPSGRFRERINLSLPGFEPQIIHPVAQSQSPQRHPGILLLPYA
jgi:hypothetical protein